MFKRTVMMLCCVLLFAFSSAKADEWNKRTVMTFSQPVELPGIVLPAGTYAITVSGGRCVSFLLACICIV